VFSGSITFAITEASRAQNIGKVIHLDGIATGFQ